MFGKIMFQQNEVLQLKQLYLKLAVFYYFDL